VLELASPVESESKIQDPAVQGASGYLDSGIDDEAAYIVDGIKAFPSVPNDTVDIMDYQGPRDLTGEADEKLVILIEQGLINITVPQVATLAVCRAPKLVQYPERSWGS